MIKLLTRDEAWRIAANIAKLPELSHLGYGGRHYYREDCLVAKKKRDGLYCPEHAKAIEARGEWRSVSGRRSAAKLLSKDEARRAAANIAKLPDLLREP